jgi:hypothetical protein
VGAKTNKIPLFSALPGRVDITGAVITADARMLSVTTRPTWPDAVPITC